MTTHALNYDPSEVASSQLVGRAQAGEKSAFDALFIRYRQRMLTIARRYVRDSEEAEDIVQEAFMRAYRSLKEFRGECAFYTWLFRITANVAMNHASTRRRRTATIVELTNPDRQHPERSVDESTPEQLLVGEELAREIRRALRTLPDELKDALVLREQYGFSYMQIAEIMDCPIGTVRSRIFRARESIDLQIKPLLSS